MKRMAFVTDSGTGFSAEFWKEKGIFSVPLQISMDQQTFHENETIQHDEIIGYLKQKKILKTSLPALGKILDLFEQLKSEGYEAVFCVPICKGLSGTLQAMESAAHQTGLEFVGFDCYSTAVVQAHCIMEAKRLYEEGKDVDEILPVLEEIGSSCDTILLCDDLDHMKRGGRLTPVAAALGGLLKIKPILHDNKETDGRVDVLEKVRTMKKAQDRVIARLKNLGFNKDTDFTVAHVNVLEEAKEYARKISEAFDGASVRVIDLVSAVGIHTGLGCLAVQAFNPGDHEVALYKTAWHTDD